LAKVLLLFKMTGVSEGIERKLSPAVPQICPTMFRDNDIFKIGQSRSRKFLWLIPFTLAKKLLTYQPSVVKNSYSSTVGGTEAHTERGVCIENIFLG